LSPPLPVLSDLDRGLRELGVPFAIVGALVPELLLEEGVVFNMAGFAHAVPHAVPTVINGGLTQTSSASPLASEAGMLGTTRCGFRIFWHRFSGNSGTGTILRDGGVEFQVLRAA